VILPGSVSTGRTRKDAVHRVARSGLGVDVTIVGRSGAHEHVYETADVAVDSEKHYLPIAYVI
jgi:molybdopterin synthase catalytic subunit